MKIQNTQYSLIHQSFNKHNYFLKKLKGKNIPNY